MECNFGIDLEDDEECDLGIEDQKLAIGMFRYFNF